MVAPRVDIDTDCTRLPCWPPNITPLASLPWMISCIILTLWYGWYVDPPETYLQASFNRNNSNIDPFGQFALCPPQHQCYTCHTCQFQWLSCEIVVLTTYWYLPLYLDWAYLCTTEFNTLHWCQSLWLTIQAMALSHLLPSTLKLDRRDCSRNHLLLHPFGDSSHAAASVCCCILSWLSHAWVTHFITIR